MPVLRAATCKRPQPGPLTSLYLAPCNDQNTSLYNSPIRQSVLSCATYLTSPTVETTTASSNRTTILSIQPNFHRPEQAAISQSGSVSALIGMCRVCPKLQQSSLLDMVTRADWWKVRRSDVGSVPARVLMSATVLTARMGSRSNNPIRQKAPIGWMLEVGKARKGESRCTPVVVMVNAGRARQDGATPSCGSCLTILSVFLNHRTRA